MVYIDDKKYACATCIKGHRSSSCNHTDRPLIEVKKKGRPITQCDHCRDLRKTKQVHVKCLCVTRPDSSDGPRTKRKVNTTPPSPTFPNGLSDVSVTAVVRQRPPHANCECDTTGNCNCASTGYAPRHTKAEDRAAGVLSSFSRSGPAPLQIATALDSHRRSPPKPQAFRPYSIPSPKAKSCCSGGGSSDQSNSPSPPSATVSASWTPTVSPPAPDYPSTMANTPVYACGCGASCACPGCTEHRGADAASAAFDSCPFACSTCINCAVTIPYQTPVDQWGSDPTQVSPPPASAAPTPIYSANPWPAPVTSHNQLGRTPSNCCGGQCQCPPGSCACLSDCCGCCAGCACEDHEEMPHYTGYQGDLRCSFQVSGERASCCADNHTPSPPTTPANSYILHTQNARRGTMPPYARSQHIAAPPPYSYHTNSYASNITGSARAATTHSIQSFNGVPSSLPSTQQQHHRPLDKAMFSSMLPTTSTASSALQHGQVTPPNAPPLHPVPFQPVPGNFTLGLPDPQLVASHHPLLYDPRQVSAVYLNTSTMI